jgi:hypothetical protein
MPSGGLPLNSHTRDSSHGQRIKTRQPLLLLRLLLMSRRLQLVHGGSAAAEACIWCQLPADIMPAAAAPALLPSCSWDDIGGLEAVKKKLK